MDLLDPEVIPPSFTMHRDTDGHVTPQPSPSAKQEIWQPFFNSMGVNHQVDIGVTHHREMKDPITTGTNNIGDHSQIIYLEIIC